MLKIIIHLELRTKLKITLWTALNTWAFSLRLRQTRWLTLRKITIWLSKNLAIFWQSNDNFPEGQLDGHCTPTDHITTRLPPITGPRSSLWPSKGRKSTRFLCAPHGIVANPRADPIYILPTPRTWWPVAPSTSNWTPTSPAPGISPTTRFSVRKLSLWWLFDGSFSLISLDFYLTLPDA